MEKEHIAGVNSKNMDVAISTAVPIVAGAATRYYYLIY